MGWERPGAEGGGWDDLTEPGAAGPDGPVDQELHEALLEAHRNVADKEVELTKAQSQLDDQLDMPFPASQSAAEVAFFMMKLEELKSRRDNLKSTVDNLKIKRDNLKIKRDNLKIKRQRELMATRPMRTLLRRSGRFAEHVVERSPTLTLQAKPLHDPAGPESPIDLDLLIASAWHHFTLGTALAAPGNVGQQAEDAVKEQTQGNAGAVEPTIVRRADVRHVGLVGASSGMGKTHLGLEVWHNRDKLDQPRFARAAAAAGVSQVTWAHVCSAARDMRVCCINFNGGCAWSQVDQAIVELSPWYEATFVDGAQQVSGAQTESPRAVHGDPLPPAWSVADAHKLPLFLRVLWGLLPQADVSFASFSQMALTRLRLGHITAAAIIAEAQEALSACRHAIIVDELTLASMHSGDRQLAELYRHIICTFTSSAVKARVLFLSLSFLFVNAEINKQRVLRPLPHGGLPPQTDKLYTPGTGGEGSPWNLVVVGQLSRRSILDIRDKLLPVASRRVIYTPRSVDGTNFANPEDVAGALASLSGGHMRSYAYLRDRLYSCSANIKLWNVVEDAFQATGMTTSVCKLLCHLVFFPGLLVAGLLPCTVRGKARLHIVGGGTPPVDYSVTFDDAVSCNLLYGSPNTFGVYEDPSLPPAMIMGLATEWEDVILELEAVDFKVSPVVRKILCACSRLLCAADVADPGRGWEVTCYWAEVMMSHVRHGAEKFLMGSPGVSGVEDFSRVALKNLYKGVDNLEQTPVHHPLLSDVLVDATWPMALEDEPPELITRYRNVDDVLRLPTQKLLEQPFMMTNAHPSFDVLRFLPVVYDPRPSTQSSSRTDGMIAVCISAKSTTNMDRSVPLALVTDAEGLLRKAFGEKNWDIWQYNVVHVTICNHHRTDNPETFLDVAAAQRTIVVCRDNFQSIYGLGLSGILSSAPILYGTRVVR